MASRTTRAQIAQHTVEILERGWYTLPDGTVVSLGDSGTTAAPIVIAGIKKAHSTHQPIVSAPNTRQNHVGHGDSWEAGRRPTASGRS